MKQFPFPLRVAAGIAVTTVERARELPQQLTELPVTVASHVLQTSMRVQQHVTELAIKGDDVLATLGHPEETPSWATFDEDTDDTGLATNGHVPSDPWDAEERALAEEAEEHSADNTDDTDSAEASEQGTPPQQDTDAPAGVTNYDELTLPQLRARLRRFSRAELEELLAYERAHEDRSSFTGMLARRINNVAGAGSEDTATR